MKTQLILMACLSLLGATACDLPDKDIGDETMGGSGEPGDDCEPGDQAPAADGCNTCTCQDDGTLACTEIACEAACEPGTSVPAGDGCNTCECNEDGTIGGCTKIACEPECEPGEVVPAGDGCNTCECNEDGTLGGCTEIACEPECEPGEVVPAGDGCNTCECNDDGTVGGCTEIACEPEPYCEAGGMVLAPDGCNFCECNEDGTVGECSESACDPFAGAELSFCSPDDPFAPPFDDLIINDVTLDGDTLTLDVVYGGCDAGQPLGGCWNEIFAESFPVQTWLTVAHDNLDELCDAFVSDSVDIDLTPMREAYIVNYGGDSGEIDINIPGWGTSVLYSF